VEDWIWQDMNLDSAADVADFILAYHAFHVGRHRVIISICKDGDTAFSVNGACDAEENVSPLEGGRILLGLLRAWPQLLAVAKAGGVTPFCYPTETDGLADKRVQMFLKAGFALPDAEGRMLCI
jgi:hypothetical protein